MVLVLYRLSRGTGIVINKLKCGVWGKAASGTNKGGLRLLLDHLLCSSTTMYNDRFKQVGELEILKCTVKLRKFSLNFEE